MTDSAEGEVLSLGNGTTDNVERRRKIFEEVTLTKTEIIEEECDFNGAGNAVDPLDISMVIVKEERGCETDERIYKCDACSLKFKEEAALRVHCRKCTKKEGEAVFVCPFCKAEISEEKSYREHTKRCEKDYSRSNTNDNVKGHRLNEKSFKCPYKICVCPEAKPCDCDKCDYTTYYSSNLKSHILRKHTKAEKKYKCKNCRYVTVNKEHMRAHSRDHENQFRCDECDYTTTVSNNLKHHVLVRHSVEKKRYKCNDCDYTTPIRGRLMRHALIHASAKSFKCVECSFVTVCQGALTNHVRARHSDEAKRYSCRYCEYTTDRKGHLLVHTRTHSEEKPYKCGYENCKSEFTRCAQLTVHIRSRHTKEKPFRCDRCDYSSANSSYVKQHIRRKHKVTE